MKFPLQTGGMVVATLTKSGCQLGTAVIEGVQGPEAVAAAHELTFERRMVFE